MSVTRCGVVAKSGGSVELAAVHGNDSQNEPGLLDIPLEMVWEVFANLDAVTLKVLHRVCGYIHAVLTARPNRLQNPAVFDIDWTGNLMPPRRLTRRFPLFERDFLRICVRLCLPTKTDTVIIRRAPDCVCRKVNEWPDLYEYSNDFQALMTALALTRQSVASSVEVDTWSAKTVLHPLPTLFFSDVIISQNLFASDHHAYTAPWVQSVRLHRVGLRAQLPFQDLEWMTFECFVADAVIPVAEGPGLRFGREDDWAWARFVAETAGALTPVDVERVGEWLQREEEPEVRELTRHLAWMQNYGIFEDDGLPEGGYKSRPLSVTVFQQGTLWLQRFVFAFFSCYGCFSDYVVQHRSPC